MQTVLIAKFGCAMRSWWEHIGKRTFPLPFPFAHAIWQMQSSDFEKWESRQNAQPTTSNLSIEGSTEWSPDTSNDTCTTCKRCWGSVSPVQSWTATPWTTTQVAHPRFPASSHLKEKVTKLMNSAPCNHQEKWEQGPAPPHGGVHKMPDRPSFRAKGLLQDK